MKVQIAKSPCSPSYSVVVGDKELWDCDCASDSEETTIQRCIEAYGRAPIMWDDLEHYSQKRAVQN